VGLTSPVIAVAQELDCANIHEFKQVLDCALSNHPLIVSANYEVDRGRQLEGIAKQRPNPTFNTRALVGVTSPGFFEEFNFDHTLELGGKRGARIQESVARQDLIRADGLGAKEKVYIGTILDLYRLRQIEEEMTVLNRTLNEFEVSKKRFRARFRLAAEQQATLRIMEIASNEYELRRRPLEVEAQRLVDELTIAIGAAFIPKDEILPKKKDSWPQLGSDLEAHPLQGSRIQTAQGGKALANAVLSVEQGNAWPNVKLGPSVEVQNQFQQQFHAAGINLTFELPVYQRNQAGIARAEVEVQKSEFVYDATQRELAHQRKLFLMSYKKAVDQLKNAITDESLKQKHTQVKTLFERGLISGEMIIELYRNEVEFLRMRNLAEIDALDLLLLLYALDGRLFEEKL